MVAPRLARITVPSIDTYCELYRDLFIDVRSYESFKYRVLFLQQNRIERKHFHQIALVTAIAVLLLGIVGMLEATYGPAGVNE